MTNVKGKFCYSFNNEEFTGNFVTEEEAHIEAKKNTDYKCYWVAECVNPLDLIKNYFHIADNVLDQINYQLEDEVICDDAAIALTKENKELLDTVVFDFLYKHAELNTYGIQNSQQYFVGVNRS